MPIRHAEQPHPLAHGLCKLFIAAVQDGQIFLLRSSPFGYENIGQRRASAHHIVWSTPIGSLYKAASPWLDNCNVPPVVSENTGNGHVRLKYAVFGLGGADAEVLDKPRVDLNPGGGLLASAFGNKFHIHERRFSRLVETLSRHHRIVPVKHVLTFGAG